MSDDDTDGLDWTKLGVFTLVSGVSLAAAASGHPFAPLFDDTARLRAGFRVAFAGVFLVSLLRSRGAFPIIYGHDALDRRGRTLRWSFDLQILATVALLVGFLTEIAALALVVLRGYFVVRTKRWGLENNIYQTTLVTLPFLGLGQAYAVDQVLVVPAVLASPAIFNVQFVLYGVMMASGGYHKMTNDMWKRGMGVKRFVDAPHLQTPLGQLAARMTPPSFFVVLNHLTIAGEFLLLFGVFNRFVLLGSLAFLLAFSVSAFSLVDLSFIGQALLVALSAYALALAGHFGSFPPATAILDLTLTPFSVLALVLTCLSLAETFWPELGAQPLVRLPATVLTGMNTPVKPFNEHHLIGVYTFQIRDSDGARESLLPIFDDEGHPGPLQRLYPRYYQASMYEVTDYCLGLLDGNVDPGKRSSIKDLCVTALKRNGRSDGDVEVAVKLLDARSPEQYLENEWVPVCDCHVSADGVDVEPREQPPVPEETYRAQLSEEFRRAK